MPLFSQIIVNVAQGTVVHPPIPGFQLDVAQMFRTAQLFARLCPSLEVALRLAVHAQILAHDEARTIVAIAC